MIHQFHRKREYHAQRNKGIGYCSSVSNTYHNMDRLESVLRQKKQPACIKMGSKPKTGASADVTDHIEGNHGPPHQKFAGS